MSKWVGRRGNFGLAKESSRGTATATNPFWIPRSTSSFSDKTNTAREEEGLGKIADSDANFVTTQFAEGEVESNLDDKIIGIILTSLMGSSPVTTGSNPYTHTYTLSNSNQHQSVSVLWNDPDFTKVYPLGVVDSLKIVIEPDAIVQFTVGFKSKVGKDWTTLTPSYTGLGSKFLHQHLIFKTADNVAGLAAASSISLKRLELTISANTMHDISIGTVEPDDVINQQFSVEGSLTLLKNDDVYRGYMLNGTYKAVDLSLTRIAASSNLQLQFPRVDFSEWEQDTSLNELASQTINFKGNYDAANALDIISTCILKNTFAGTGY